jgi:hypothetical protein
VANDPESPYVGGRSLKWLKVKVPKYREQERGFYKPEYALLRCGRPATSSIPLLFSATQCRDAAPQGTRAPLMRPGPPQERCLDGP